MARSSPVIVVVLMTWMLHAARAFSQTQGEYELWYAEGNYERIIQTLGEASSRTTDAAALKLLGDCHQKLGNFDLALEYYDRARILGYAGDDLFLHRGICKTSLASFESARMDLLDYLNRHTDDPAAYYWMAALEYQELDNSKSLRFVNRAIELDTSYAPAYYLRGAIYTEQRKNIQAYDEFEQAYRLDPTIHRAKLNMAILLLDMQRYTEAGEILSEAILESPEISMEALYYRGEIAYLLHDNQSACSDWYESATLGDKDAEFNYKKMCLDRTGKPRFKRRSYAEF